jgi:bacillithiol system protein YtxJ
MFQRSKDKLSKSTTDFPFKHPQSFEDLAGILRYEGPTFIYKHSTRCSVSLFAMKRLSLVEVQPGEQWVYIDVVNQRPMSLALAEELNVWHESPQLILVVNGVVKAHGSHHQVTETTVENWREQYS